MKPRRLLLPVLLCLLSACAGVPPPPATPCVTALPAAPSLPLVPPRGIFAQAQALLARDKLQGAYARQLEALLAACR